MPRNVQGSIVRHDDLWGREPVIDELWRRLAVGDVMLVAPRRHGKSSLMYALHDRPRDGWSVVLIDVMDVTSPEAFVSELAAGLLSVAPVQKLLRTVSKVPGRMATWLASLVDQVDVGVPDLGEVKIKLREALPGAVAWQVLADEALDALAAARQDVVVVLDEFPVMVDALLRHDPEAAVGFLRWMQRVRRRPDQVHFLLGGSMNIDPLLERVGHEALLNDLDRFTLRPFSPDAARRFVGAVLDTEGIPAEEPLVESICETVRSGVPFFLQVMISEVISALRVDGTPIDQLQLHRLYVERVVGPMNRQRFSHWHTRLREYGADERAARILLREIAALGARDLSSLVPRLADAQVDPARLDAVLVRLEADYYLVRESVDGADRVRFADELIADWWRRNATDPGRS